MKEAQTAQVKVELKAVHETTDSEEKERSASRSDGSGEVMEEDPGGGHPACRWMSLQSVPDEMTGCLQDWRRDALVNDTLSDSQR